MLLLNFKLVMCLIILIIIQNYQKKYSEKEISDTGLFYKNDKYKKYINRFYSRIIFPIRNITGDVIAFGGRIIEDKKIAKYINSPETEFYKKGKACI